MGFSMKQRKKQPVQTRSAILEAAGSEFSRKGYSGAGLGPIVASAGLTKGALFHHYPDKRSLAVAWATDSLAAAMESLWLTPLGGVASLDAFRSLSRARCMELQPDDATSTLVAITAETAAADPVLAAALDAVFSAWKSAISSLLERGKAAGWIHRSIQPEAEAAFYVAVFSGFTVTTKASPGESVRRTCATALEAYLETLRAQ
jgi:AcrR family transcriptional regulator